MSCRRAKTHQDDEGDPRAGLLGDAGVLREDEGPDEDHREDHEAEGRDILEREQGRELHVVACRVSARGSEAKRTLEKRWITTADQTGGRTAVVSVALDDLGGGSCGFSGHGCCI